MTAILLVAQIIVVVAMIGTILLQRSEGGALGLGGGGGVSGLMSGRGAANALSRSTVFLGAAFIAISLALAMIAKANSHGGSSILLQQNQSNGQLPPGQIPLPTGAPKPVGSAPATPAPTTAPIVPAVPVPAQQAPAQPAAPASGSAPAPSSTPAPAPAGAGH